MESKESLESVFCCQLTNLLISKLKSKIIVVIINNYLIITISDKYIGKWTIKYANIISALFNCYTAEKYADDIMKNYRKYVNNLFFK